MPSHSSITIVAVNELYKQLRLRASSLWYCFASIRWLPRQPSCVHTLKLTNSWKGWLLTVKADELRVHFSYKDTIQTAQTATAPQA